MIQGNDSFRLIVRRGPQPNQSYELNKDIVTLGRDITNDIVINDPEVSRHHLRLTRGAGTFAIEDLGSTNGTFINGQRLTGPRPLRPGDMVGLGETVTLAYEAAASAMTAADAPPAGTVLNPAQRSQPVQPQSQPYQPSQPVQPQASPYAPPQGYPPSASQPAQPQPMQPSQPYSPQGASQQYPPYNPSQPYSPSTGYTGAQPSSPYGAPSASMPAQVPQGTGYGDYDPYAIREEGQNNTARFVLIGCALLSILCCCSTIVGAVAVDQMCLWNRLPIIYPILQSLGYVSIC